MLKSPHYAREINPVQPAVMCVSVSCCHRPQGETAMDTLRQWQRTYSRELDQDTRQECVATEKLLRKALAGGGEAFLFFILFIFLPYHVHDSRFKELY